MLLTIDIGNTNILMSIFDDDKKVAFARMRTDTLKTSEEYAVLIKNILHLKEISRAYIDGAIISSVVPALQTTFRRAIHMLCGVKALTVGPGLKTGLHINIDNPAQLGSDMVCVSVAALEKYPGDSIVVDLGTATTVSAVRANGEFLGCSILPGIRISLEALASRAAQLQQIDLSVEPKAVIGKNTVDSMTSGILYGNAAMVDGMVDRYKEVMGGDPAVIITGGNSSTIANLCRCKVIADPDLLIDGLRILYHKNKKTR